MKLLTMKPREVQKLIRPLVVKMLAHKAAHLVSKEITDARAQVILNDQVYLQEDGTRVTEPDRGWLIRDEQCEDYFARLDAANRAAGWNGPEGTCPTLVEGHEQVMCEWKLLEVVCPLIDLKDPPTMLADRQKLIDLLCGLALANA